MQINLIILVALILAAVWTVMTRSLLRAGIGLALVSVLLTIVIFRLNSPLAAVFELSVCAGLISVLFVSTISMAQPLSRKEAIQHMKIRFARYWYLPIIVVLLGVVLLLINVKLDILLPTPEKIKDARLVIWNSRPIDLLGQIIILLTGVFGVVILFKERLKK
ncbi:MAG: NADH-quinone oxidoreductase subunit J [Candidatus Omnitrophica bacterium]|nr:NADH-quinone oxidoreductase subunit J [Candidatus Omnitrophota bacterium]